MTLVSGGVYNTKMIQVVIDTNVIVSGLRSRKGSSFLLLQQIGKGKFDINLSVPLLLEYREVLFRQLSSFTNITKTEIEDLLDYYCAVGHLHDIYYLWRPVLRDPRDEMVLEVAVKAQCEYIITFNTRDFMGIDQFGIGVLSPGAFLKQLGVL